MEAEELLAHPYLLLLVAAVLAVSANFLVVWVWGTVANIRIFRLICFVRRKNLIRSEFTWSPKEIRAYLAEVDKLPSLGDERMDTIRRRLRWQFTTPLFKWLLAGVYSLAVAVVLLMAIVSGRCVVLLMLIPFTIVFYVFRKVQLGSGPISW